MGAQAQRVRSQNGSMVGAGDAAQSRTLGAHRRCQPLQRRWRQPAVCACLWVVRHTRTVDLGGGGACPGCWRACGSRGNRVLPVGLYLISSSSPSSVCGQPTTMPFWWPPSVVSGSSAVLHQVDSPTRWAAGHSNRQMMRLRSLVTPSFIQPHGLSGPPRTKSAEWDARLAVKAVV